MQLWTVKEEFRNLKFGSYWYLEEIYITESVSPLWLHSPSEMSLLMKETLRRLKAVE